MLEIWANLFLPKALKSCPKSNKLPNLVTLQLTHLLIFELPLTPVNVLDRFSVLRIASGYVLQIINWHKSQVSLCTHRDSNPGLQDGRWRQIQWTTFGNPFFGYCCWGSQTQGCQMGGEDRSSRLLLATPSSITFVEGVKPRNAGWLVDTGPAGYLSFGSSPHSTIWQLLGIQTLYCLIVDTDRCSGLCQLTPFDHILQLS